MQAAGTRENLFRLANGCDAMAERIESGRRFDAEPMVNFRSEMELRSPTGAVLAVAGGLLAAVYLVGA